MSFVIGLTVLLLARLADISKNDLSAQDNQLIKGESANGCSHANTSQGLAGQRVCVALLVSGDGLAAQPLAQTFLIVVIMHVAYRDSFKTD